MQEEPPKRHGELLQDSQGCPDRLGAGEELEEVEEEVPEIEEVLEVEELDGVSSGVKGHDDGLQAGQKEDPKEVQPVEVLCPDIPPSGYKLKFCIQEDVVKNKFVTAVVNDPTLSLNEEEAAKIFDKMITMEQELGLKLGPIELKEQLNVKDQEEKEEKKEEKDGPQSSTVTVAPWIEKMHEEWDSSDDSTVVPSWAASSQDLEEKLANTAPEDYMNVAAMHEIKAEKKERRENKKGPGKTDEKAGSDGFTWSPLTKKGFNDFILYCQGGNPTVERCTQLQQLPTPEAPKEKVIKWKPITKDGLRCFMDGFAHQVPDPFALVAEMAFGDFVEASIAADVNNLPKHIDQEIAKSIVYVHELYHLWGVDDFHDIEWWLQDGWGPLLVVSLLPCVLL